jgi:RNA polymerase sigma-70 factor (ECF subfamily)
MGNAQLSGARGVCYGVEVMVRSDVQLMLGVKQGDEASFELLLRRYRTPLCHFLNRMVRDQGLAEDLAQEVFLRVYRARREYVPSAKFTTWMFRIATNLALNALRDSRHRQSELSLDAPAQGEDGSEVPLDVPDGAPRVEQRLVENERVAVIRKAIFALPEKQRAAVLLHKYHEMDYDQIAGILGCSVSALKSLLFRAYQVLRVELAPLVAPVAAGPGPGGTAEGGKP